MIKDIKKIIIFTFFLLFPCIQLSAQFVQSKKQTEEQLIEKVSKAYPLTKDTIALHKLLQREQLALEIKNQKSAQIISNTFLALKSAEQLNRLNPIANRLFENAFLDAKQLKQTDLAIWVAIQYGFQLYTFRLYEQSYPYFSYCINRLEQDKRFNIIQPIETYKKAAYFLSTVGDYEKAEEFLIKAKTYAKANSSEMASITDGLGLVSLKKNNLVAANLYFNAALSSAKASNDQLRYAKALGNIAEVNFIKKNYPKAIELLQEDIAISKKLDDTQNTMYALLLLGKVYLASGNNNEALKQLSLAREYAQTESYFNSSAFEINTLILELTKKNNNNKEELVARRNLESLKNQLKDTDGEEVLVKLGWETEKNRLKLKIESKTAKLAKESYIKTVALIGCIMLIILILIVVKSYQNKIRLKQTEYDEKMLKLTLAKVNSEEKLHVNHQTIASYKTYLFEKNRQIKELEFEMSKIKQSTAPYLEKYANKMQTLLESQLMSDESWFDFKKSFIQLYPTYYSYLKQNFNDLTDSNLRIIFLTKLELNNTEIARILGLTIDAVKKAKQRLKKKYINYDSIFSTENIVEEINS